MGRGYAPEGARALLDFAFERLGRDEIVAMTARTNARSRRVMEKLGMTHATADDFEHPSIPPESPLRSHVLYSVRAAAWRATDGTNRAARTS